MRQIVLGLLVLSIQTHAQQKPEVASVKVNRGGGGTRRLIEPGKLTYLNLSLGEFIALAYGVKHYQLVGPEWILNLRSDDRYDVVIQAAERASADELKRMLEPVLVERFHLSVHREVRTVPVFALVVDKGGPKFKQSAGGRPESYPDGTGGLVYKSVSMEALADGLSNFTGSVEGRPVLNRTELTGTYDFNANLYGLPGGLSAGEQKRMGQEKMDTTARDDDPVFNALREQLGLRLDSQRAPLEMVVIDHADKVPTGN